MCTAFLSAEEFVPNFVSANPWGGVEEAEDGTAPISPQQAESFFDRAHVEGGGTPKESLVERLHTLVAFSVQNRSHASKITGILVQTMDELELVKLINDNNALQAKIAQMRASLESIKFRELAASGSFEKQFTCACVCVCVCVCVCTCVRVYVCDAYYLAPLCMCNACDFARFAQNLAHEFP